MTFSGIPSSLACSLRPVVKRRSRDGDKAALFIASGKSVRQEASGVIHLGKTVSGFYLVSAADRTISADCWSPTHAPRVATGCERSCSGYEQNSARADAARQGKARQGKDTVLLLVGLGNVTVLGSYLKAGISLFWLCDAEPGRPQAVACGGDTRNHQQTVARCSYIFGHCWSWCWRHCCFRH
jgi:hypothetical protein